MTDFSEPNFDGFLYSFDVFWAAYPKHVGKKAAKKAWDKLKPPPNLAMAIIADVTLRKRTPQWTKSGGQFVPHASTYLNGARWEDETEANVSAYSGIDDFVRETQ